MAGRLAGKRCLIVGGTSGIGLAAVKRFLTEGARLVVVGCDQAQVDDLGYEVAGLGDWFVICADATDAGAVEQFFADAATQLGGLDVLYHVAGASGRRHGDGSLHECSDDGWAWTLNANLTSTFITNRAAVRHFLASQQPGVILNMASVLAFAPSPRHFDTCAYATAKGGVIALSRYAAARYATDGIRVNVLVPGLIDTPMAVRAVQDPAIAAFLRTKQPLRGGPGTPDDLADAAVFLCSDESHFITGAVLPADGGWCVSEGQFAP
jgi:NAD(P)-dependent dehydrogenase (short-subunit alcohol dehydrogenase family)